MFKTVAPFSNAGQYVDENQGTGTDGTKIIAEDRNRDQTELVNAVEKSGQTLDATKADLAQLARALTINGVVSMLCTDSGAADAYILSNDNAGIEKPTSYNQLDGAAFLFSPANPNTGIAATINYQGLGNRSLTDRSGNILPAGAIAGNVMVVYNLADSRFELFVSNAQAVAASEGNAGVLAIATSAEVETGTDDTKAVTSLKLQEKIDANVLGIGQTWQDVTGSRSISTVYTNTTGRPIEVKVIFTSAAVGYSGSLNINGVLRERFGTSSANGDSATVSAVIPDGATYQFTVVNASIVSWNELRA